MKYYCLHHSPAKERKEYLNIFFYKQKLDVEWIENFLPTSDDVLKYPKINCVHAAHDGVLNNAEISLCLKHNLALEKICKINDYAIIFEDDIQEISWSIEEYMSDIIKTFEQLKGDILWIGSDPLMEIESLSKITMISNANTKSRYSHCYMLHSVVAEKVIDYYKIIQAPPDWQWNITIDHFNLKSCWMYPSIFQRTAIEEIPSLLRK